MVPLAFQSPQDVASAPTCPPVGDYHWDPPSNEVLRRASFAHLGLDGLNLVDVISRCLERRVWSPPRQVCTMGVSQSRKVPGNWVQRAEPPERAMRSSYHLFTYHTKKPPPDWGQVTLTWRSNSVWWLVDAISGFALYNTPANSTVLQPLTHTNTCFFWTIAFGHKWMRTSKNKCADNCGQCPTGCWCGCCWGPNYYSKTITDID